MRALWTCRARLCAAAALFVLVAAPALLIYRPAPVRAAQSEPSAPLPRAWRHWKYFRSIRLPAASEPQLVALVVPVEVYRRARRGLTDLRIINDRGEEVPYAALTFSGSTRVTYLPRRALQSRYVPGDYTGYVLDLGPRPLPCDFLLLTSSKSNPFAFARIDASDDGQVWRLVRDRIPLARLSHLILAFSETRARFLRLRVFDPNGRFAVESLLAGRHVSIPADRVPVTAFVAPEPSTTGRVSLWRIELRAPAPVDEADFETAQQAFSREVVVSESAHGRSWQKVGGGLIFRTARGASPSGRLRVVFDPHRARFWRVELRNENDPPLAGVRLRLSMTPRRIVFRDEPGHSYRLLYGQSEAAAPRYDLAETVSAMALRAAPLVATTGPEQGNADWIDPRPWSEKHGAVLWIATLLALLILGYAAWRALRRPEPPVE